MKLYDEHVPRLSRLHWHLFPNVVQAKTDTSRVDPEHGNVSQVLYKLGHDRNQVLILVFPNKAGKIRYLPNLLQ